MEALRRRSWSLGIFLLGLGVVLFAVGGKLVLIERYGTDQPFADQWAAEGMYWLRGPLYYDITFDQVVSFHGEHRPGLTRLWVRGLILGNEGQWDCFLELVANLLIYAAFLAVAWRWLASLIEGIWLALAAVVMALLFALPCAYENFLWGFQSQFLFLLLCGTVHVYGTLREKRLGPGWCLAQVAGLLGLFSIAAGVMSSAALMVVAGFELVRDRRNAWVWATLIVNLALFGLGFWLLPENLIPVGSRLAHVGQALLGMGYLLSWPFEGFGWSILLQAPWLAVLVTSLLKRDGKQSEGDTRLAALGCWVAGMAFAIAYGRTVTSDNIGVRYYDVLVLGLFVNLPALARLVVRQSKMGWRLWWSGAGLAWLVWVGVGMWNHNRPENLRSMFKFQYDLAVEQRQVLRDFMATDDPTRLQEFENTSHRFPHFQITLDFLRDPQVPALLPPSLTPDGHENRLSRFARRIAANSLLVLGLGVTFATAGVIRLRRESTKMATT